MEVFKTLAHLSGLRKHSLHRNIARQYFGAKSVLKGNPPAKASKEDKTDTEMPSPTGNCQITKWITNDDDV